MRTKVVKAIDCSILKITGVFFGDQVRWHEGYITLIQTIGPYFSVMMKLLFHLLQLFQSFLLDVATTYFEIFSS